MKKFNEKNIENCLSSIMKVSNFLCSRRAHWYTKLEMRLSNLSFITKIAFFNTTVILTLKIFGTNVRTFPIAYSYMVAIGYSMTNTLPGENCAKYEVNRFKREKIVQVENDR